MLRVSPYNKTQPKQIIRGSYRQRICFFYDQKWSNSSINEPKPPQNFILENKIESIPQQNVCSRMFEKPEPENNILHIPPPIQQNLPQNNENLYFSAQPTLFQYEANNNNSLKSQVYDFFSRQVPILGEMFMKIKNENEVKNERRGNRFIRQSYHFTPNFYDQRIPQKIRPYEVVIKTVQKKVEEKKPKLFSIYVPPQNCRFEKEKWGKKKKGQEYNYLFCLRWQEDQEIIQNFEGSLDIQESIDDEVPQKLRTKHEEILQKDEIQIKSLKNRFIQGEIYRKKINLPEGYKYLPSTFEGFIINNFSIFNEFGRVIWPGQTNISNTNFSEQFFIEDCLVHCQIPALMKEAIVEFYSLPKRLKKLEYQEQKDEVLRKMCSKRKAEVIQTNFDEEKWKIKINFDT